MFVTGAVAARIEAAQARRGREYAEARRTIAPGCGAGWATIKGGCAYHAGQGSPVYGAVGLGLGGPASPDDLDTAEALHHDRGSQPTVLLCPLADPSAAALLRRRCYALEGFESVLAAPLVHIPYARAAGIEIRRAGPEEAELWITTSARGFAGTEEPPPSMLDLIAPNFHSASAVCFLALADGRPAGAGALFLYGDVAVLGGASTLPAFRGRGVQAALLDHRLAAARDAGADLAITMAAPGSASQRNAERAGLHLAYTCAILVQS